QNHHGNNQAFWVKSPLYLATIFPKHTEPCAQIRSHHRWCGEIEVTFWADGVTQMKGLSCSFSNLAANMQN
ncbi:MAG: hypothetical protein ACPG5W_09945, partial [Flavobacteriales bacterium]